MRRRIGLARRKTARDCKIPPLAALGEGGGGERSQVRSILIVWDESLAEVLSRGRLGAILVYYCVTSIKIGREKEDQQVLQVLRCFTAVRGQICAENCERYWVGGQSEEHD